MRPRNIWIDGALNRSTFKDFYAAFVDEKRHDPAIQGDLADSLLRLASLTAATDSRAKAIGLYKEAIDVYERLAERQPEERGRLRDLAGCHNNLANQFSDDNQYALAEKHHKRALEIRQRLAKVWLLRRLACAKQETQK